jgi:hypothetical protein
MLASLPFVKQFFAVGKNVGWVASGYWMLRVRPTYVAGLSCRVYFSDCTFVSGDRRKWKIKGPVNTVTTG